MLPSRADSLRFRLGLHALAIAGLGCSAAAMANPFGVGSPVSDTTLGQTRGGFTLPNGIDVSIGIQIDTHVNGQLALRTVLNVVDAAKSELAVYTAAPPAVTPPAAPKITAPGAPRPVIVAVSTPSSPGEAPPSGEAAGTGGGEVTRLALVPNGQEVQTDWGSVSVDTAGTQSEVVLRGPTLELQHLLGSATGIVVANRADNSAIDTIATVNIELHNSAVPIGNSLLRIEAVALGAAARGIY